MKTFEPYVRSLELLALRAGTDGSAARSEAGRIAAALDGQPGVRLRELVTLAARRNDGAFFTGAGLAERALRPYAATLSSQSVVYDPACGAGDLLVACARQLPLQDDLVATISLWGEQLRGVDIHPEFIRAAKARLVLLAISRGVSTGGRPLPPLNDLFSHIRVGDGLDRSDLEGVSHLVLNPPFPKVPAPPDTTWGAGTVSQAALFVERSLASVAEGTRIVAILPDVLRAGSLYARWRATVETRSTIETVEIVGAFDAWADVDVFILRMVAGLQDVPRPVVWWPTAEGKRGECVGDQFHVYVGPVVPHRHKHLGHWYPYVHARLLPAWDTFDVGTVQRRRFKGRTFTPPFVAVRRTSAPGDNFRALATLVMGHRPVAVENHLLVVEPHDGSLESCTHLLDVLRDERTNHWLDERIRCRHLTVGALRDLPWWGSAHDH